MSANHSKPGGCLLKLAQQLFIITVSKQLVSNVQEFIVLCVQGMIWGLGLVRLGQGAYMRAKQKLPPHGGQDPGT